MTRSMTLARLSAGLLLAAAMAWQCRAAQAQTDVCDQLRQAIAVAAQADPQQATQYARAAQRQRAAIARTQAYSDQIGCSHGFSIFGGGDPPQCDTISAQLDRMNNNLAALEQQVTQFGGADPDRLANLQDQYRASCSPQATGLLPDADADGSMRQGFDNPDADAPQDSGPRHYGKAVCVRTCDGGYFPLSFAPAQRDEAGLQNLCTALCPNAEVKLYTTPDYDNISAAIAADGTPYKDLPNALRYQKVFDPACACKPPGKTWVEALAGAEQLLDKSAGNDVTVTAKMSEEMSRPVTAPAATPAPSSAKASKIKGFNKAAIKALLDAQATPDPRPVR